MTRRDRLGSVQDEGRVTSCRRILSSRLLQRPAVVGVKTCGVDLGHGGPRARLHAAPSEQRGADQVHARHALPRVKQIGSSSLRTGYR